MSDEYIQIGGVRVARKAVKEFKGKLESIMLYKAGWYLLKIEGLPGPLLCHINRVSELNPKAGEVFEGLFNPMTAEVWKIDRVKESIGGVSIE